MKYTLLPLVTLILFACSSSISEKETKERILKGDFAVFESLPNCNCDSLSVEENLYYLKDSLFTGTCTLYYPESNEILEKRQIFRGEKHGLFSAFTPKGDTLFTNLFKDNELIETGLRKAFQCHCDSLTYIDENDKTNRTSLFGYYFSGKCFENFDDSDSIKTISRSYKNGYLDGLVLNFDNAGNIISEQKFKKGELVY